MTKLAFSPCTHTHSMNVLAIAMYPLQFCMLVDTGSANTAIAATSDPALGNNEFYDLNL